LQTTVKFVPPSSEGITVTYAGDTNYAPSTTSSNTVIVTIPDFTLPQNTALTITAGQTQTFTVNVTPLSASPSTVTLTPLLVPSGMTVSFNPSSVNLNGAPVPVMVTLTSTGPSGGPSGAAVHRFALALPPFGGWISASGAFFCGSLALLLVALSPKRRSFAGVPLAAAAFVMSLFLGCGGGGGGGNASPVPTAITLATANAKVPANSSYTMTATVTSSKSLTGTVNIFVGQQSFGNAIAPPITLINGQATATAVGFQPGTYAFWANYSGDTNNQPSQTTVAVQQVFTGTAVVTYLGQTSTLGRSGTITVTLQ
jgi:hypothetical protein